MGTSAIHRNDGKEKKTDIAAQNTGDPGGNRKKRKKCYKRNRVYHFLGA